MTGPIGGGLHRLRNCWRRRAAELERAIGTGEPDRLIGVQWR
jgi:hypothetical protein